MKKLFTILTVAALATTTSFAQFSVKAGTNLANITTNEDVENGMKIGMIFGANYSMELSDAMSLDMSLAYKQSGTKQSASVTVAGVTTEASTTFALDYLDISPSLSFNLSDAIALSFGPYIAFAVGGKTSDKLTTTTTYAGAASTSSTTESSKSIEFGEATFDANSPDGISSMDIGINIGTTYFIGETMSVSAGYSLGLTDLVSVDPDVEAIIKAFGGDLPSLKNNGIYVVFGYNFGG